MSTPLPCKPRDAIALTMSPGFHRLMGAQGLAGLADNALRLVVMAMIIEQVRGALQRNESPDAAVLFFGLVFSLMVAWAGFFWFQKTRKGFADVI